jgi:hypothetical protein
VQFFEHQLTMLVEFVQKLVEVSLLFGQRRPFRSEVVRSNFSGDSG